MKVRKKIGFKINKEVQEIMFIGQIWEVVRFENISASDDKVAILRESPSNKARTGLNTPSAKSSGLEKTANQ